MKRLKNIITITIWTVCVLYLSFVVLLNIPAVQSMVGTQLAAVLTNKFNTTVSIKKVDLGLLNRIIIDDFRINDQAGKKLLSATRLSVKIAFSDLVGGNIKISSAQLFGLDANIYRKNADAETNMQFIIDALASKDTTKTSSPLNIEIGSLVIRHGKIAYNQLDSPDFRLTSLKHINLSAISAHVILNKLSNDSINLNIKKLAFNDKSGLQLKNFSLKAHANLKEAYIERLQISLPHSILNINTTIATYKIEGGDIVLPSLQYRGEINDTQIYFPDLQAIIPQFAKMDEKITLASQISGTSTSLKVEKFSLHNATGDTKFNINGAVNNFGNGAKWYANITQLKLAKPTIAKVFHAFGNGKSIPSIIENAGDIGFTGSIGGRGKSISANGQFTTDAGSMQVIAGKENKHVSLNISTHDYNIGHLLGNDNLGTIDTGIKLTAELDDNKIENATAIGKIGKLQYNGYLYHDINVDGKLREKTISGSLDINDNNIKVVANGTCATNEPKADISIKVSALRPKPLNISNRWEDACFAANINARFAGTDIDHANGYINIANFRMENADKSYHADDISLSSRNADGRHTITLNSDFANVGITGRFHIADIIQHVKNLVTEKLPNIQQLTPIRTKKAENCKMLMYADIYSAEPLRKLLGIPLDITKPVRVDGYMNSQHSELNIQASAPRISYNGQDYADISLTVATPDNTLHTSLMAKKVLTNGNMAEYNLNLSAADNRISTSLQFDNHSKLHLKGNMNANAQIMKNSRGEMEAVVNITPSQMLVDNTNWDIKSSTLTYSSKHIDVRNFAIEHGDQHIHIDGMATAHNGDSLIVDLKDVDVAYILNLVNFHAVDFGGKASGKACVTGIFGTPHAKADLKVGDFTFENGRMGTLYAQVAWNNAEGQIDINATAKDKEGCHTDINGYVSPKRNYIDLGISAHDTQAEFMLSFCSSFMDKCNAKANGDVRLWGPLNAIELTGDLNIDGNVHISSLNTDYTMHNANVKLRKGQIIIPGDTITDKYGNTGVIDGSLYHQHLARMTYDIGIKANNLLSYDFDGTDGSSFYGRAFATGQCNIRGRSGEVIMDIDVTPNTGTIVTYNTSSPDAIKSQEFIHWADRDTLELSGSTIRLPQSVNQLADMPSDIRLNFLIHTQPTATMRLIMDQTSGDYIDLRGSGVIRATYYNKGSFDLYGNYLVESGIYKLTIQNALHKDFEFLSGGTIAFGGNPYDAVLNLKAMYPVNSVSLSDLQLGRSFTSNNIRVNCLMNITGTPNQPKVDFGLDMPTVSNDAKQMIYSLINSEEEMNQQVIYLLAVGRFYSQAGNNASANGETQSQTSLAMQSILSGQISQQINSLLGSIINSGNWNFGANISTGDEGWNNAEYEGLLSGRLLNNRLLINGQFGYRDNANATTSFIGDFDIRYLLYPNGNLAVRVYNQANDRYFTRNSLNTQGLGFILKKDFDGRKRKKRIKKQADIKP